MTVSWTCTGTVTDVTNLSHMSFNSLNYLESQFSIREKDIIGLFEGVIKYVQFLPCGDLTYFTQVCTPVPPNNFQPNNFGASLENSSGESAYHFCSSHPSIYQSVREFQTLS
jgi:hypothetical protein